METSQIIWAVFLSEFLHTKPYIYKILYYNNNILVVKYAINRHFDWILKLVQGFIF